MENDSLKIENIDYYIFLEISENSETGIYLTNDKKWYQQVIKNYKFKSDKNLVNFLKPYKEIFIGNIPDEELEKIEKQNYLDYLEKKWFNQPEFEVITPEEILDLGIKYKCFNSNDIIKYLLKNNNHYKYEIKITKLNLPIDIVLI